MARLRAMRATALTGFVTEDAIDLLYIKKFSVYRRAFDGVAGRSTAQLRRVARKCSEKGRGGEAAAEFQKVLDHRGIVLADPIGAVARLQLGRALASLGEKDRARSAYQDFLTLWKRADSDIPILEQARREFAGCAP